MHGKGSACRFYFTFSVLHFHGFGIIFELNIVRFLLFLSLTRTYQADFSFSLSDLLCT